MKKKPFLNMLSVLAGVTGGSLFVSFGVSMMKFGTNEPITARFWGIETGFLIFLVGLFFPLAFWYGDLLAKYPHLFKKSAWAYPGIFLAINYGVFVPVLLVLAMFPSLDLLNVTPLLQTSKYIIRLGHLGGPNILGYVLTSIITITFACGGAALMKYSWRLLGPNYGREEVKYFQKG